MSPADRKPLRASFADFVRREFTLPEHLWHYTDGTGLLGIASSQSLWCTEYRHLNDRKEMSIFSTRLQQHLRERLRRQLSSEDADLVVDTSDLYRTWNVFVCSFCADRDRNEHWHQYARRAGYALGFDPHVLRSLAEPQNFILAPVFYG